MTMALDLMMEEPIQPNLDLVALDEVSQRLSLAAFSLPGMYRYSVMWAVASFKFTSESTIITRQLAVKITKHHEIEVITGWRGPDAMLSPSRHRLRRNQLERVGWSIHEEENLNLATRVLDPSQLEAVVSDLRAQALGWFVRRGSDARGPALWEPPFRDTMRFFCVTGRLAPSEAFLRGLGVNGVLLLYPASNDMVRPRIVIVSPRVIPDIGALLRECQIRDARDTLG